jgi:uncharacterized protein
MKKIIKEIYNEVENRCMADTNAYGIGAWDHHIKTVYEIATSICEEYNADYNIVALSALLHDIASVTDKELTEEHHIHGVKIAEELLSKYDIEQDKIEHIKKCILNHRGSRLAKKNTPEEICIADADAMAHFYNIPSLLSMVYVEKGLSIDEGAKFVYNKLERSYNKLSPKGKKIIKKHYESAKILLNQKH